MKKAEGTFSIVSWNESVSREKDGQKTTRATVEYKVEGGLQGQLLMEYSLFYPEYDPEDVHSGSAVFTGSVWFSGEIDGRSGSFGALDNGEYAGGEVKSSFRSIKKSGKGELSGIRGEGSYSAGEKGMVISFQYELA